MNDNVTKLAAAKTPSLGMSEDGFLAMVINHVKEQDLVDLDGEWMDSVELVKNEMHEIRIGPLNLFESQMFALAMLCQEIIQDIMIEAQAQTAEEAARQIRQQKSKPEDLEQSEVLTDEDRVYLNELSVVFRICQAAYEFSARTRFNNFDKQVIVREGFVLYANYA